MKDFIIHKPSAVSGYPIHRAVAALTQGAPHLWRDNGATLTIRTAAPLDAPGTELPEVPVGALRMFTLRASVGSKVRGRHIYPPPGDHQVRQDWLARQGQRHGFEVIAVHCTSDTAQITDQIRRAFSIDSTDFTGVLKVTDAQAFARALRCGVGSTGRAFGYSLLSI